VEIPKTRYARSQDGTFLAYQVFGQGPDLLLTHPWLSHLELIWEYEPDARWLQRLARSARVIQMDQRGIGLSDRMTQVIDLETKVDDLRAVLDAANCDRAALYGQGLDGGAVYTGTTDFKTQYRTLTELAEGGDFEAIATWYAGLSGASCVKATVMSDPARLVIDVSRR
jgi:pimeloyl-ACP methyl ester carboxylesterase